MYALCSHKTISHGHSATRPVSTSCEKVADVTRGQLTEQQSIDAWPKVTCHTRSTADQTTNQLTNGNWSVRLLHSVNPFSYKNRQSQQWVQPIYTVRHKNCTLLTGTITLQNYAILWWFLAHRCTWKYPIACLFESLCKIENWEPAYQICYCLLSSRQQHK